MNSLSRAMYASLIFSFDLIVIFSIKLEYLFIEGLTGIAGYAEPAYKIPYSLYMSGSLPIVMIIFRLGS
jgi:hypothetical protein